MCTFSTQQLADRYGVSLRTMERHIAKLRDNKTFIKTSIGKQYNEPDARVGDNIRHIPPQ
jgi:DeoR/GlpR family transcriptional regulator of sugar metabolism